jgi:hypothetical protein
MKRFSLVAVAVAGALLAPLGVTASAQAQLVDRSHEHITGTSEVQICGLDLVSTVNFVTNEQERIARSGFPLFKAIANGTQTFTNPDTGKSITNRFAGVAFKDLSVTDNGDGTITLRTASAGLPEKLVLPDGTGRRRLGAGLQRHADGHRGRHATLAVGGLPGWSAA